jgi:hypothetical protein
MVKITDVCDKVIERLRGLNLDVDPAGDVNPATVDMITRQAILVLGFQINERNGQIYDPTREDDKLSIANMRQHPVYSGMPRRRRGLKR